MSDELAYYVIDIFAATPEAEPLAGPFKNRRDAEKERREMNIADDCLIVTDRWLDGYRSTPPDQRRA